MAISDQGVAMTRLGGQARKNHSLEMMMFPVWVDCSASMLRAV